MKQVKNFNRNVLRHHGQLIKNPRLQKLLQFLKLYKLQQLLMQLLSKLPLIKLLRPMLRRQPQMRRFLPLLSLLLLPLLLLRQLLRLPQPPHHRATRKSLIKQKRKSHIIKGWLSKRLSEEWRGELEALRDRWRKEGKSDLWIKILTRFELLKLLKAYLQIKVENIWLPKKRKVK
jgi:hypothetical protein